MRRWILAAHLYAGLSLGAFFSLIGLTGSFLVYYPEIDRLANPELSKTWNYPSNRSYQEVLDALKKHYPERTGAWRIEVPRSSEQAIYARYLKPEERHASSFAPLIVAMDPENLSVINSRFWGEFLVTWIYDLHYSFLLGDSGKVLSSATGIALLVSLLLGVLLWWPPKSKLFKRLVPRIRSGRSKLIYDLHAQTGVYFSFFIALIAVTGIGLATPQWIDPIVNMISHRWEAPVLQSAAPTEVAEKIGADRAIKVALQIYPKASVRWLQAPVTSTDVYMVRLKQPGELSDRFPKTYVWVDQYSGAVISTRDAFAVPAGDKFFDCLHPIHNGEALGAPGRFLALVVGLVPFSMFLTGLIWWRKKRNAKSRASDPGELSASQIRKVAS